MFHLFLLQFLAPVQEVDREEFFIFKNIIAMNVLISGELEDFRPSPLPFNASQSLATVAGS